MRVGATALVLSLSSTLLLTQGCGSDADPATASGGSGGQAASSGSGGAAGSAGSSGGTSGASGAATGGSAGASGASGGSAGAGTGGNSCNDPGPEPNDSIPLASPACGAFPCEAEDCDDTGSTGYKGKLAPIMGTAGPGDVDYHRFDGKDKLGFCQVNAAAKTDDSGFKLCIFPSCPAATVLQGCKSGTVESIQGGLKGCCITAPGEVEADHDCTGTPTDNDSAEVFVRVTEANACTTYTIDYHF